MLQMGHPNNQTGEHHQPGNASQPNTYSLFSPVWAQQPVMNERPEAQPSESALNMALLAHQVTGFSLAHEVRVSYCIFIQ